MAADVTTERHRAERFAAIGLIAVWTVLNLWLAAVRHLNLRTNAFDLSIFDYALWSSLHGRLGYVPFLQHSILSEHFMPTLWLLLPAYAWWQSPWLLIVAQVLSVSVAAWLMWLIARRRGLSVLPALAILVALLWSRRDYGAFTNYFYPECFQPALTLGVIVAFERRAWVYWPLVLMLLGTKEDAALYVAMFAALQLRGGGSYPGRAVITLAVAVVWLAAAMLLIIPASRRHDGMAGANPFVTARYAEAEEQGVAVRPLLGRVFSGNALETTFNAAGSFGFLPLGAPTTLLVALPGLLIDLAAKEDTRQAWLSDHYFWPFIPWLALAATVTLGRIERWRRDVAAAVSVIAIVVTALDSPLLRSIPGAFVLDPAAQQVRAQLPRALNGSVVAQPNLLPHLPHTMNAATADTASGPATKADVVLLTPVGDTWPLSAAEVEHAVRLFGENAQMTQATRGPLYTFTALKGAH